MQSLPALPSMTRSIPARIIALVSVTYSPCAKNELRGGKAICGHDGDDGRRRRGREREEGEVNETKMRARDMRLMAGRNAMRPVHYIDGEAQVLDPS